jgi:hypothetical protein
MKKRIPLKVPCQKKEKKKRIPGIPLHHRTPPTAPSSCDGACSTTRPDNTVEVSRVRG